jgi:hypothetical protein
MLWFSRQKYTHKIFIAGNHDLSFDSKKNKSKGRGKLIDPELKDVCVKLSKRLGLLYLENSMCDVAGLKIYGSPNSPSFNDWAFQIPTYQDEIELYRRIPKSTDILLTHCPPHGVLDIGGAPMQHLGSTGLADTVFKKKPRYHIFGHIHEGHGTTSFHDTTFINASFCSMPYNRFNTPIDFEVEV